MVGVRVHVVEFLVVDPCVGDHVVCGGIESVQVGEEACDDHVIGFVGECCCVVGVGEQY